MPFLRHPDYVYRYFRDHPNDVVTVDASKGSYRLASSLFKSEQLSVDDGAYGTPTETQARASGNGHPVGVAMIPKSVLSGLGTALNPDPMPGNPGHCTLDTSRGTIAKKLQQQAVIVLQLPGKTI